MRRLLFITAICALYVVLPVRSEAQPDRTIVVLGDTTTAVVPANTFKQTASLKLIDGHGKFVLPGVVGDAHAFPRCTSRPKIDVANGALGPRGMGDVAKEVFPVRDAIAQGKQAGPKIVAFHRQS